MFTIDVLVILVLKATFLLTMGSYFLLCWRWMFMFMNFSFWGICTVFVFWRGWVLRNIVSISMGLWPFCKALSWWRWDHHCYKDYLMYVYWHVYHRSIERRMLCRLVGCVVSGLICCGWVYQYHIQQRNENKYLTRSLLYLRMSVLQFYFEVIVVMSHGWQTNRGFFIPMKFMLTGWFV